MKKSVTTTVMRQEKRRQRAKRATVRNGTFGKIINWQGNPPTFVIPKDNVPYHIRQTYNLGIFQSSTSGNAYISYNFRAQSLDQITTLQALFDQYRITLVEVFTIPRQTGTYGSVNSGQLISVIDLDDSVNLTTIAAAYQYQNALVSIGIDGHHRKWQPQVSSALYNNVGQPTGSQQVTSPWIDAASADVPHFGIKFAWTQTDIFYTHDVMVHLHTEWRNVI